MTIFNGAAYLFDGFELITKPGLKRYVIIPAIINIIIFIGLFMLASSYISLLNQWVVLNVPTWLDWITWFIWILFLICYGLFFIYAFVIIANLVGAPFNSLLAEKVEFYLTGNNLEQKTWLDNVKSVPSILGRQFKIIGYYALRVLLIFILLFIPIVQAFVPFIWFAFNAWFMAITYLDYPSDNHHIPLDVVHDRLNQKAQLTFGFGGMVLIASMIPVINFFTIPAAVAGATKLWLREFEAKPPAEIIPRGTIV